MCDRDHQPVPGTDPALIICDDIPRGGIMLDREALRNMGVEIDVQA